MSKLFVKSADIEGVGCEVNSQKQENGMSKVSTAKGKELLNRKVKLNLGTEEEFAKKMIIQMQIENPDFPDEAISLLLDKNGKLRKGIKNK